MRTEAGVRSGNSQEALDILNSVEAEGLGQFVIDFFRTKVDPRSVFVSAGASDGSKEKVAGRVAIEGGSLWLEIDAVNTPHPVLAVFSSKEDMEIPEPLFSMRPTISVSKSKEVLRWSGLLDPSSVEGNGAAHLIAELADFCRRV